MSLETIINNLWIAGMIFFPIMFIFIVVLLYPNLRDQSQKKEKTKK